ncbi:hypothetical protein PUNSTDRAFT_55158 [Punctularia strigosozonata HHB-11173 SS5]|uniref:FAD-binding domain-containing protein n=1 Tax=Punctularia strigosozonata (strain HHB-11173) TaxID=741275 RepID=R7S5Y7_PUNST|nr:uncharacterized protein PUNSTDRAFT_55158 [Punctularia strigosozonata HHB-11173 SS5]EIN05286.1 hypothetical protein PUNSTDRAFT_55158 [Punctularia strigosozonata HHB-11173 SS5]
MGERRSQSPSILIVGAGPTGLILALVLARNGVPFRIIEKDKTTHLGQRGPGIQARTQELLSFAGVLEDVLKIAQDLAPARMYKLGQAVPEAVAPRTQMEPSPSRPMAKGVMIGQSRLCALLTDRLAKDHGVHVETNTALRGLEQHPDKVTVSLANTGEDGTEVVETSDVDWVVGSDGARGTVRKLLGLSFHGDQHAGRWVVADVRMQKPWTDATRFQYWFGHPRERCLMVRPTEFDTPDLAQATIVGDGIDTTYLAAHPEEFLRVAHDIISDPAIKLAKVDWISEYRPSSRMVDRFSEGRVFVAGDAAHIHPPTGGQGLNSGVQDAVNLGWKLALVAKGLAPTSLLSSYNEERLPVIREVLQLAGGLWTKMRSEEMKAFKRDSAVYMLEINYRWSEAVVDERLVGEQKKESVFRAYYGNDDGVRAGDRAPEAPGLKVVRAGEGYTLHPGEETSLFKLFKLTTHTVLLFVPAATHSAAFADIQEALCGFPAGTAQVVVVLPEAFTGEPTFGEEVDLVLHDKEGHAFRHYGCPVGDGSEQTVVVVRPDSYVGAYTTKADDVHRYLKVVFGECVGEKA